MSLEVDNCTANVSRQEFEDLLSIVSPGKTATPEIKQRFAKTYAELLAFGRAAKDFGLADSTQYRETMQWLQVKTLADLLRRQLEKESAVVPDEEITAFYQERISQFEEVKLQRLVLPKSNFAADDIHKFEQDAQRIAHELRDRAVRGEDLARLQKEGYEALGFGGPPPGIEVGNRRRSALPAQIGEEVFALQPGEVSQVQNEAYSFVVYRVEARRILPENEVREEIVREVTRQKLARALQSVRGPIRTELNQKYFGTTTAQ